MNAKIKVNRHAKLKRSKAKERKVREENENKPGIRACVIKKEGDKRGDRDYERRFMTSERGSRVNEMHQVLVGLNNGNGTNE